MKSPTAVTHDDMTDLPINLKYWVSRHKRVLGTNPTDEQITSGLPVTREQSPRYQEWQRLQANRLAARSHLCFGERIQKHKLWGISLAENY
jgi:hypothetical protein